MISLFISGQQSISGQHQVLRCFGILTETKIKTIILKNQSNEQRWNSKERCHVNQSLWPLQSFVGSIFHTQKQPRWREKLKARVTTKRIHYALDFGQEARTLRGWLLRLYLVNFNHELKNVNSQKLTAQKQSGTVTARTVKREGGFKDIFKGGKGAFCTTHTWLTVLRGPLKTRKTLSIISLVMRGLTHLNKDDFFFISGQQSNSGQHQVLRCFGILTEIKTKQSSRKRSRTNTERWNGEERCHVNQSLWPLQSFVGSIFNSQKQPRWCGKLKAKVTTKRIHYALFIGLLPKSANSTSARVVTQSCEFNHDLKNAK